MDLTEENKLLERHIVTDLIANSRMGAPLDRYKCVDITRTRNSVSALLRHEQGSGPWYDISYNSDFTDDHLVHTNPYRWYTRVVAETGPFNIGLTQVAISQLRLVLDPWLRAFLAKYGLAK